MIRVDTEVLLAQGRPAEALAAAEDALDRFDVLQSAGYAWPLLVAGARTCATTTGRDDALHARAAVLWDRLRAVAGKLAAEGAAQQAHQLTLAAEAARAGPAPAAPDPREPPPPRGIPAARDQAPPATHRRL